MRSMRNDLTKTAQAAREPEVVQNKVFKAPQGSPRGAPRPPWRAPGPGKARSQYERLAVAAEKSGGKAAEVL